MSNDYNSAPVDQINVICVDRTAITGRGTMPDMADDAELVLALANTHADCSGRAERFADAAGLAAWLTEHDMADAAADVTTADVAAVRELRDALITVLLGHSGDPNTGAAAIAAAEDLLRRTAARHPLVTVVDRAGARLVPAHRGLSGALGALFAAMTELAIAGTWKRLKACRNPLCHFAFHDHSRNTSGAYCGSTCGTRVAMRNYRQRHRSAPATS
jgi:predicted RNA-binding Zn ribbon-like protein